MKALHLFCLELGRLFQSRLTWLVILLTVLSPLAGPGAVQAHRRRHHAVHVSG